MKKTFPNEKDAVDAIEDAREILQKAMKLHQREGLIEATPRKDGSFDVRVKPKGASGCDE